MLRIDTRPLTASEEQRILDDKAPLSLAGLELGCFGLFVVVVTFLVAAGASNIALLMGRDQGRAALIGVMVGLVVSALWLRSARGDREWFREHYRRRLAAGPVEHWVVEPVRAWNVRCPWTRAFLFELDGGRRIFVASDYLAKLPPDRYPQALEIDVLPQVERVLSLVMSDTLREVEAATLEGSDFYGDDKPVRKRRFMELLPEGPQGDTGGAAVAGGGAKVSRVVGSGEAYRLRGKLTAAGTRVRAWLVMGVVPVAGGVLVHACSRRADPLPDGVAPSILALLLMVWGGLGSAAGRIKRRALTRLLAGDLDCAPAGWRSAGELVHVHGRARRRGSLVSPFGGEAIASRLGSPCSTWQADDFAVDVADGAEFVVDAEHSWLVQSDDCERVVRVESQQCSAVKPDAIAARRRSRFWFPTEQLLRDGDTVHVIGLAEQTPSGRRIRGTAEWPVLICPQGGGTRDAL